MNAQIFVQFEDRVKQVIKFSSEGYIIPLVVYYGFSNDKDPGNYTIWYNLNGEAGSEIARDLYKTIIKVEPPVFFYDGFKAKVNPFLDFKKIVYRIQYGYKHRNSNHYDIEEARDSLEVFSYPAPTRDFWDAVTYY